MRDINRRLRSVVLAAVLVTNGLPVAPLWGALTGSEVSCPQHGRACVCAEKCARAAHEHPKPAEAPKPACHRQTAEAAEAVPVESESPAEGCAMRSCGPEAEWTAATGEIRYLPDRALTEGLYLLAEGATLPETTARFRSLHSPPPVPPPQV